MRITGLICLCQFSQADIATEPPIFNADHSPSDPGACDGA
jgi:hypothetical protein